MNIVITGSSGYIGSHIINELHNQHQITGIDVHSPESQNNYRFIQQNVSRTDWSAVTGDCFDVFLHLSQSPDYRNFPEKADKIAEVNIFGTLNSLEWSRKKGIKRFVFASTGNVYKSQDKLLTEEDVCDPIDFYGATKFCSEQLCRKYAPFFEIVILRIFGVYGPKQKNMMIQRMVDTIKNDRRIVLAQNKGLVVNPVYISDAVEIFNRIITTKLHKRCYTFNMSGNEILTYLQMAETISQQLSIPLNIETNQNDPVFLAGSNDKISTLIHYTPQISFNQGIKKVLGD